MTEAYADVKTGEVTVAIKDSKDAHDNPIKEGDVIGIADGHRAVGSTTEDVVMALLGTMEPKTPTRSPSWRARIWGMTPSTR